MRLGFVALQVFLHQIVNRLLIPAVFHVDEIADDEAPDIAQAQLPRDFVRRFEIGLENCFLDVAPAFVPARIHVHRHERFGFVDHDIAAALQPDLAMKRVVDLLLHTEGLEDRRSAVVKLDAVPGPARNLAHPRVHPIDRGAVVADHLIDFIGEKIAHRAFDQIRLFKDAARRRIVLDRFLDARPLLDQQTQVAHEIAGALAFADGANDHTDAFRNLQAP